ncbi:MAG: 50S ribosomal protein L32 [Magnetococcales bacterium]|nr:50S ribosomal protein L32 [Magnetococcales bacterium]MBF0156963.1 50S ribosomal protein L32 [Magnetococcales bacterium]
MAVPKKRQSRSRGRGRSAHSALRTPSHSVCPNCQEPRIPHRVCPKCGFYRGREVIEIES